jgi:hypothetical protein
MDIRQALKNEYRSALAMLRQTIERCPLELWVDRSAGNRYWHIATHTLMFAHLYMMPTHAEFSDWLTENKGYWDLSVHGLEPFSQQRLLEYADYIDTLIDDAIDRSDLDSSDSGFGWYSISKLEHQIMNIRHIQHHMAQLADRLRQHDNIAIDWRG